MAFLIVALVAIMLIAVIYRFSPTDYNELAIPVAACLAILAFFCTVILANNFWEDAKFRQKYLNERSELIVSQSLLIKNIQAGGHTDAEMRELVVRISSLVEEIEQHNLTLKKLQCNPRSIWWSSLRTTDLSEIKELQILISVTPTAPIFSVSDPNP